MSSNFEHDHEENEDYGKQFRPDREIYVVKKDGSKELFNVQKVISAVGKSAYRALTKFTKEEKEQICQYVVDKVNELEVDEVPIPILHIKQAAVHGISSGRHIMHINIAVATCLDLFRGQEEFLIQFLIQLIKDQTTLGRYQSGIRVGIFLVSDVHDGLTLFIDIIQHPHDQIRIPSFQ